MALALVAGPTPMCAQQTVEIQCGGPAANPCRQKPLSEPSEPSEAPASLTAALLPPRLVLQRRPRMGQAPITVRPPHNC